MGIETKVKVIDGKEVIVTSFPAREGLRIKARLIRVIAPAVAEITGTAGVSSLSDFGEKDLPAEGLFKAVGTLVNNLDKDDIVDLFLSLLQYTKVDKKPISETEFDVVFAGNYAFLYKISIFVIQVNGFFSFGDIGKGRTSATVSPAAAG